MANTINSGEIERVREPGKERNWYHVEQFCNAPADYEVTVFESEHGRGPVIEVRDPETDKKVSVALIRKIKG